MYGQRAPNAQNIYLYSKEYELIKSFSSQVEAAEYLNVHQSTIGRRIKSGKFYDGYLLTTTLLES